MTSSTPTNPNVLPADAKCPRCGYEFGIAGQTRCSECGLEIDAAAVRAIEVRKVAGRKLLVGLGVNAVALVVLVMCVGFSTRTYVNDLFDEPYVLWSAGVFLASLAAGYGTSTVVRKGERQLWADAWARSHLLLFAHWIAWPLGALVLEPNWFFVLLGCWVASMIVSIVGAGVMFRILCDRRQLDSRSGVATFAFLRVLASLANVLVFIALVFWHIRNSITV